jgi:raffinose/stachyose/melibiose transport system permease protein
VTADRTMEARGGPATRRGAFRMGARGRAEAPSPIERQGAKLAVLFLLPGLLVYAIFMLYPFVNSIWYSLTDWNGATTSQHFVGIQNYIEMFQDSLLWQGLRNNLIWVVLGTISPVVIGLLLAMILWSNTRGSLALRALYFLPFILPTVVVSIVWSWIYHPLYGILPKMFKALGLDMLATGWLGDPSFALIAVLIAAVWATFGFVVMVLYAGLQGVNIELVEAAMLDGANWFQRARYIVIPQIAPVLTMVTAVTLIGGFSVFDFILVMTGGGPGTATEVLGTVTYKQAFGLNRVGYGAAISMLITLLSLVSAVIFVRVRERGLKDVA